MARPEEAKVAKAMKEAKTAREMVLSWATQAPGRDVNDTLKGLRVYLEKKPEMIPTFSHNALTQVTDRGILDAKTRYLITIAVYMALRHWGGVLPQCCNAKAAGCTEEEILETAFLANYGVSKCQMSECGGTLSQVFEDPMFKGIQKR
jgi:alkylhydroperoxidase/carboxymuconolactone decarboxylase family protein YurZ